MTHQSEMIAWVNVAWKPVLLLHQTVKQAESESDCKGVSYFLIFVNDLINPALGSKQLISVCYQKWQFPWSVSNMDFQYLVIIGKKYLQNSAAPKFIAIQKLRFTVKENIWQNCTKITIAKKDIVIQLIWKAAVLLSMNKYWLDRELLIHFCPTSAICRNWRECGAPRSSVDFLVR